MKMYWGVEVKHHTFLILAPDGGEWSSSYPGHCAPGEKAQGTD